jgi:hypothetical protein
LHASWRAVVAGDLDEAESHCEAALHLGAGASRPEAHVVYLSQRIAIRWAQDRIAEEVQTLERLCEGLQALPGLRAPHALAVFREGDVDAARAMLLSAWNDGAIEVLPHDQLYVASLTLWGELATAVGEIDVSRGLFGMLEMYHDRFVFTGAAVYGPVAHTLGCLAEAIGDPSVALDYLDRSMALCEAMQAPLFARRSERTKMRLSSGIA